MGPTALLQSPWCYFITIPASTHETNSLMNQIVCIPAAFHPNSLVAFLRDTLATPEPIVLSSHINQPPRWKSNLWRSCTLCIRCNCDNSQSCAFSALRLCNRSFWCTIRFVCRSLKGVFIFLNKLASTVVIYFDTTHIYLAPRSQFALFFRFPLYEDPGSHSQAGESEGGTGDGGGIQILPLNLCHGVAIYFLWGTITGSG